MIKKILIAIFAIGTLFSAKGQEITDMRFADMDNTVTHMWITRPVEFDNGQYTPDVITQGTEFELYTNATITLSNPVSNDGLLFLRSNVRIDHMQFSVYNSAGARVFSSPIKWITPFSPIIIPLNKLRGGIYNIIMD